MFFFSHINLESLILPRLSFAFIFCICTGLILAMHCLLVIIIRSKNTVYSNDYQITKLKMNWFPFHLAIQFCLNSHQYSARSLQVQVCLFTSATLTYFKANKDPETSYSFTSNLKKNIGKPRISLKFPNLNMEKQCTGKCDYLYVGLNKVYWKKKWEEKERKIRCPSWYYMFFTVLVILTHRKNTEKSYFRHMKAEYGFNSCYVLHSVDNCRVNFISYFRFSLTSSTASGMEPFGPC